MVPQNLGWVYWGDTLRGDLALFQQNLPNLLF
jgi:hypothetical protein